VVNTCIRVRSFHCRSLHRLYAYTTWGFTSKAAEEKDAQGPEELAGDYIPRRLHWWLIKKGKRMSVLIDRVLEAVPVYNKNQTEIGGRWYAARPFAFLTIRTLLPRLKDACAVALGRAFAVHYKEDEGKWPIGYNLS